jgi:hypothetical protein
MHALVEFCLEYPSLVKNWHDVSNYLCFLTVANEAELTALAEEAHERYIIRECFFEPDLGDALTAVVLDATDESRRLTAQLKLALK